MDSTSFPKETIAKGNVGLPSKPLARGAANSASSTPLRNGSADNDARPATGTGGKGRYSVLQWCSLLEAALHALPDAVTIRDASGGVIFENQTAMTPEVRAPDSVFVTTLNSEFSFPLLSGSAEDNGPADEAVHSSCFVTVKASVRATNPVVRRVLDSMPHMNCQMSKITKSTNWLNKRWYQYTGMRTDDKERQTDFVHPNDRAWGTAYMTNAMAAERPFMLDIRVRGANGEYRWHTVHGEPVSNDNGDVALWVATATDTSAQKQLRQDLETKTALLHTALDQLPVSVVVTAVPGFMQFANRVAMAGAHHVPM
jgi:PAS domain S-box-containing protein